MTPIQAQGCFVVIYHVRGRRKRTSVTAQCVTLQDIIRHGEQNFPSFQARNPWICIDSESNTVVVGIDPESQQRIAARQSTEP